MLIATVTTQRSGSKLLGACFNKGIAVRSFGEIFFPTVSIVGSFYLYLRARGFSSDVLKMGSDGLLDQFISEQFFTVPAVENRPVHFDVMFNQLEMSCISWNPFDVDFMYGYLRSRNAVVIDLRRSFRDAFISRQFLAKSGISHRVQNDRPIEQGGERQRLDVEEFLRYCASIKMRRERLSAAMSGYEHYVELDHDELAAAKSVPEGVKEVIVRCGAVHGRHIDAAQIQMAPVDLVPTGVDYSAVFENVDELPLIA